MVKERIIVLLACVCIVVSAPTYYLVNTYRMTHFINPSDNLTTIIKFLPNIVLSIILLYGFIYSIKLADNKKMKDAIRLGIILIVLMIVAMIVTYVTFDIGIKYVM
jgi:hypothetical protein